jgi:uncharacterized membrane protein YuzA (DUF378 family)
MSDAMGRSGVPHLVVMGFAVLQGIRYGFLQQDYLVLVIGALASMAAMVAYALVGLQRLLGKPKAAWMAAAAAGGFIPYLYCCYLVFYRGVWRLADLRFGFALTPLLSALAFIILGYVALKYFYLLTELSKRIDQISRDSGPA